MTGPCSVTHPPFGGAPGRSGDEPVFAEPWQAQAFAMVLQLHQRGLFSWPEWAAALAAQINAARPAGQTGQTGQTESSEGSEVTDDTHDSDDGRTYYRHWLAALEALVASKGAASTAQLARCAQAWHTAAGRTPHGLPVVLQPADFGPA